MMLGFDLTPADCEGLMGFALYRTDHTEDERYYLRGLKSFAATDPGFRPGESYSTRDHPIQSFGWSDYSAKPGHEYTYRVEALSGPANHLEVARTVRVTVGTESEAPGDAGAEDHAVFFNRGVAASQAYVRRFGDRRPGEVGAPAFEWLSRGLAEAIDKFIRSARPGDGLRVAAYEFHSREVLESVRDARDNGVDVQVVYDRRNQQPGDANAAAVRDVGIEDICTERRTHASYIHHNKFVVRIRSGNPDAVLTGGTNLSESGIFGHANNVHIVYSSDVAQRYLDYWELLRQDLPNSDLRPLLTAPVELPRRLPPHGSTAVFSPRESTDALDYYARIAGEANDSLFMTFAFGMHPSFQEVYRDGTAELRYATLEKKTRPMAPGPERDAEEGRIDQLRFREENLFAIGSRLTRGRFDRWVAERNTGLNRHVRYIHNKFMLIDPLSSSPVVVTGSANFSTASSIRNDENMLMIRDNRRVADIYLGEFMRLYRHHAFREWLERPGTGPDESFRHLDTSDQWWRPYYVEGSSKARQRVFFAGSN